MGKGVIGRADGTVEHFECADFTEDDLEKVLKIMVNNTHPKGYQLKLGARFFNSPSKAYKDTQWINAITLGMTTARLALR